MTTPTELSGVRDERTARMVWSRLTEPDDEQAASLLARKGAVGALRDLLQAPGELAGGARWSTRLSTVDVGRDLELLARYQARVLIPGDEEWPTGIDGLELRRPICLWVRGPVRLGRSGSTPGSTQGSRPRGTPGGTLGNAVAVVGARACTWYGERMAADLAAGCAELGFPVISGAAYGIDAAAHRGALAAGGVTIAVLACGVERAYPRGHDQLLERIAQEGAVVSEVPPGSAPTRWRFVKRNRLIAAMASATVVVEAGIRSGASITAREAANLGRHVGAVPGPVTSASSAGAHELLRQGAVCITGARDVAELLAPMGEQLALPVRGEERPHDGLSEPDARVYEALPLRRGAPLESIAAVAGLDDATVAAGLGRLELLGLARHDPAGWRRAQGTHRQVNGAPA